MESREARLYFKLPKSIQPQDITKAELVLTPQLFKTEARRKISVSASNHKTTVTLHKKLKSDKAYWDIYDVSKFFTEGDDLKELRVVIKSGGLPGLPRRKRHSPLERLYHWDNTVTMDRAPILVIYSNIPPSFFDNIEMWKLDRMRQKSHHR